MEDYSMAALFDNTAIKSLELPNRAVRSATWSGVGDDNGRVTDRAVEFYQVLASGGIGLIITGYQYVLPNGRQINYTIGNYDDAQTEGLSRLAQAVHDAGGRIVTQIVHCGLRADPKLIPVGWNLWGPSVVPDPATGNVPREVTRQEIQQLVEAYAAAAARSKQAGFDGVQLHGAHGYGINQFLSGYFNRRGDAYGGNLDKRYRFLGEVMEAVRGAVGNDFPVLIKLNAHDFVEGGLVPQESVRIARRLVDDGIDTIEVSAGSSASPPDKGPSRTKIKTEEDEAYLLDFAAAVKQAVAVPVITVGGIRSLKTIETILSEGKADYVAMARPFIREPHLIKRWEGGDRARAKCISCNGCFETGLKGLGISCKVERKLKEKETKEQE
jgi:2,4-dienoyl-CoA reductase-like NADH-dependent reductase (Old Yellow Enzyme family)